MYENSQSSASSSLPTVFGWGLRLADDPVKNIGPIYSLACRTTILEREWGSNKEEHVVVTKIVEQHDLRSSTKLNPLALFPCIKGGCAIGKWCDKQVLNRATYTYESGYDKGIRRIKNRKVANKLLIIRH